MLIIGCKVRYFTTFFFWVIKVYDIMCVVMFMEIILRSASPRRKELLERENFKFNIISPDKEINYSNNEMYIDLSIP